MSKYGIGNYGHYRGRTLQDMLAAAEARIERENERKATQLEDVYIDLVGLPVFNAWVSQVDPMTWEQYLDTLRQLIDDVHASRIAQDSE